MWYSKHIYIKSGQIYVIHDVYTLFPCRLKYTGETYSILEADKQQAEGKTQRSHMTAKAPN